MPACCDIPKAEAPVEDVSEELVSEETVLEVFSIHRFVDHACYLAVASERKPSDSVFRLPFLSFREKFREPPCLCAEELYAACVEEEEELVHPDAEHLGESEMAQLVHQYEHGQGEYDLQYLYNYYHDILSMSSPALMRASAFVAKIVSRSGSATKSTPSMHSRTTEVMS